MVDWFNKDTSHVWRPFTQVQTAPPPIPISHAKNAYIYDTDGKQYLDAISSWWVITHGHAHPCIANAIAKQAHTMAQVIFANCTHAPAACLAAKLSALTNHHLSKVFYSDDGSTAVEVAIKMAFQYFHNTGDTKRKRLLALEGGYHGDTVGAMSAGAKSGFFAPFYHTMFDVATIPCPHTWWNDPDIEQKEAASLQALDIYLDKYGDATAAFICEPLVQGAGGMRMYRLSFLKSVVERLRDAGILVIFDEVMTGFGRTGEMLASHTANVTPDLLCVSKGLTAGFLPLSATLATQKIYDAFLDGDFSKAFAHGHSFTANPLGCAAALASFEVFEQENTLHHLKNLATVHHDCLSQLAQHPKLHRPRHMGAIAAIDIRVEDTGYTSTIGKSVFPWFKERGILLRPLGNTLYIMAPYCITQTELIELYENLSMFIETI